MADSLGVDHKLQTSLPAPVLSLDLQQSSAREIVMTIFDSPNLVYVHLAPPCGTASRAREIRRSKHDPKPARSEAFPDCVPDLLRTDPVLHKRVMLANALYRLTGELFREAHNRGIFCSVENPLRSHMWETSYLRTPEG